MSDSHNVEYAICKSCGQTFALDSEHDCPGLLPRAAASGKSAGQVAYEEDCRRCPVYGDGKPRRTWDQLRDFEQESWHHNPTARDYKTTKAEVR